MDSSTPEKTNSIKTKKIRPKLCLLFNTRNTDELLFDYSAVDVHIVKHETNDKKYYYCRIKSINKIINRKEQNELLQIHNLLFKARKSTKGYYELIWPIVRFDSLDLFNLNKLDNKMWLSIKTEGEKQSNNNDNDGSMKKSLYENENEDYYLSKNDIIKFGEKKYEVIELNIVSKNYSNINEISKDNQQFGSVLRCPQKFIRPRENEKKYENKTSNSGYNQETDCRICFGSKSEVDNFLIKICKCKNIFYHIECLKKYLKSHVKSDENLNKTITSYNFENFACEVCQDPYPLKFFIELSDDPNNKEKKFFYLVDGLNLPENTNYMILESLTRVTTDDNKMKKNKKNIFVIKLTDKPITIGRSDKNDIVDIDGRISREHAILKFDEKEGKVIIKNKGRFGTSVLIKNNIKLHIGQKIYFQVGNTYIKAEVKEDDSKEGDSKEVDSKEKDSKDDSTDPNTSRTMNFVDSK